MWVTQSYLGDPDKDPKVYAYYLFEDYSSKQVAFTKSIEERLAHIGDQFGPNATILLPNPANAPRIENEVRGVLGGLWHEIRGQLPGLLVSTKKLSEISIEEGDYYYFSFLDCNSEDATEVIREAHRLMWQIAQHQQNIQDRSDSIRLWKRFIRAIEVKPGVFGVSIDLRKFLGR